MTHLLALVSPLILAASEEGGHAEKTFGDGGALAQWAWLIPVLPMLAAFAIVFFGQRTRCKGWGMACGWMLFVAVYGVILFISNLNEGITYEGAVEIGNWGADGLGREARERADRTVRLSSMTLTHEMARLLLVEQVYRGLTILRGMPYHRA